jgi:hypothetical protein
MDLETWLSVLVDSATTPLLEDLNRRRNRGKSGSLCGNGYFMISRRCDIENSEDFVGNRKLTMLWSNSGSKSRARS